MVARFRVPISLFSDSRGRFITSLSTDLIYRLFLITFIDKDSTSLKVIILINVFVIVDSLNHFFY